MDGNTVAAEYTSRMMNLFTKLSFPRLQNSFDLYLRELYAPALFSEVRAINALNSLFQTTVFLSRALI